MFARLVRALYSTPLIRGLVPRQLGNKWNKGTFFMHILWALYPILRLKDSLSNVLKTLTGAAGMWALPC